MKQKIDISKIEEVLKKELSSEVVNKLLKKLISLVPAKKGVEEEVEKTPQKYVVIRAKGTDDAAWVVQAPESVADKLVAERIVKAVHKFNTTKKGRKHPVLTFGDAFETVKSSLFKEREIKVKTKTLVGIVEVENTMPPDEES